MTDPSRYPMPASLWRTCMPKLSAIIVDRIVAEHPDAADEPCDFCARTTQVLANELGMLLRADPAQRLAARLVLPATGLSRARL